MFSSHSLNGKTFKQRPWTIIFLLVAVGLIFSDAFLYAQDASQTQTVLRRIADGIVKSTRFEFVDPNTGVRYRSPADAPDSVALRPDSPYADWRYWNGVVNIAMLKLGDILKEPTYTEFPKQQLAYNFDHYQFFEKKYRGEGKWNYPFGQHFIMEELDDCGAMGASVIEVVRRTPEERYRSYIDLTAKHIESRQSRMNDSTLVRSFPRRWTLWADDLYMGISFLARMGEYSQNRRYFDDAALQVIHFHRYLFDPEKGIMHHCWYSDSARPGIAYWGRANGWAMVAQVDLLDRLPADHPQRTLLLQLLRRHIRGIVQYQSEGGLWHQLLDKPDSYPETSCSAMFVYTIALAVRKGYIEPSYASNAKRGWSGVLSKIRSDGNVEGVCTGTGVGDDLQFYYQRPAPLNDVHGIGTVLLAGAEILALP